MRRLERIGVRSGVGAVFALLVGVSTAAAQYVPPVGIPAPPFGINESHTRYEGRTFAAGGFTYRDAGNGPYSHYVNRSAISCTDSGNTYGTSTQPRCTVPASLPAGSVVEVHGGTYGGATWNGSGTATNPIFIRGIGSRSKARFNADVHIAGTNMIVEYIEVTPGRVFLEGTSSVLRNSHVHHGSVSGALVLPRANNTVVYANEINNISGGDRHGVNPGGGISNIWILDNTIYECEGDAVQFCHGCIGTGNGPANVYIGGNRMYSVTTGENAIDIKETRGPVIISENEMWGYKDTATSNGEAIRINDEGSQGEIWIINNRFRDMLHGIQPQNNHSTGVYILGNLFTNLSGSAIRVDGGRVYNNTISNVRGSGIDSAVEFRNNVIVNAGVSIGRNTSGCSHNLVSGVAPAASCTSTLSASPLFLNVTAGDFQIQAGSPARNSGTTPAPYATFQSKYGRSIAYDLNGNPRPQEGAWDRGAFEYGSGGQQTSAPTAPTNLRIVP